jgi:hypothetical protein
VREAWSHDKHSLAALFGQKRLRPDQKIRIVDSKKAHLIELGEPLGY